MKIVFILLAPFFPVLIFYILDTLFYLKIKLIKLFNTTERYKKILLSISITLYILFSIFLFLTDNAHLINLAFSIIFLYKYLIHNIEDIR